VKTFWWSHSDLSIASITQNFNCVCVAQLILDYRDTLPKSRYWAMTMSYSKLIRIVKDWGIWCSCVYFGLFQGYCRTEWKWANQLIAKVNINMTTDRPWTWLAALGMLGSTASVCRRYGDNDAFPQKENNQFFTLNNMLYNMFCKIPRLAAW